MAKIDFSYIERAEIIGYSPLDKNILASKIAAGYQPSQLPGDFILIVEGQTSDRSNFVSLITSAVCATPYYIYQKNDRFVHGKNVFDVARKAKINWKWNHDALNSILLLSYCLGNDSLHRDIERANPACIYYFCAERLTIVEDSFPTDIFSKSDRISSDEALNLYNRVCDEYYSDREICLSLSAGYDSRALLASLLKRGIKPIVGTEGNPESTDVKTASAIAKDLNLEHRVLQLAEDDYIKFADLIIETTSGELSLSGAWGAFLFLQQVQFPHKMLHLMGANGELFRTFYFDKGILCQIADLFPALLLKQFFSVYLKYREKQYKNFPMAAFLWNQQPLESSSISDRCYRLSRTISNQFSDRLDYFYTFYRVRNYIGKGFALYNLVHPTSSPFLDYRVVMAGAKLQRKDKLNNFFHQQILLDSYPQLLDYPVNNNSIVTTSPERNFYWLKKKPQIKSTGKSLNDCLMENAELIDICYNSPYLDNFIARQYRQMAVENKLFAIFSFLITMHFASAKIARLDLS